MAILIFLFLILVLLALLTWVGLAWAQYARQRDLAVWNYRVEEADGAPTYFLTSPLPRAGWRIVAVLNKPGSLDLIVVWGRQS